MDPMDRIRSKIPKPSLLESLAEESSELAHAALKCSRILRGENPTPVEYEEAEKNLVEEVTDVMVVLDALGYDKDIFVAVEKTKRWLKRLDDKEIENGKRD